MKKNFKNCSVEETSGQTLMLNEDSIKTQIAFTTVGVPYDYTLNQQP